MFPWVNIELTSRCNGNCWFCGRNELRKAGWKTGDMDYELFHEILDQLNPEVTQVIQFNKDGEALLYSNLRKIGIYCSSFVTNLVTNGKLLMERKGDIVGFFDSLTVSVIEDDVRQLETVKNFINWKGNSRPEVYIKFLGDYYNKEYKEMGLKTMRRVIHHPMGDWEYKTEHEDLIPEIGVCLDFLFKPSISWDGNFHICNRFDKDGKGIIGNVKKDSIVKIWHSEIRDRMLKKHIEGKRNEIDFCSKCHYWGIPRYI